MVDENEVVSRRDVAPGDPSDVVVVDATAVNVDEGRDAVKVVDAESVAGACDEARVEEGDVADEVELPPVLIDTDSVAGVCDEARVEEGDVADEVELPPVLIDTDSVAGVCDEARVEEDDVADEVELPPVPNDDLSEVDIVLSDVDGELDVASVDGNTVCVVEDVVVSGGGEIVIAVDKEDVD